MTEGHRIETEQPEPVSPARVRTWVWVHEGHDFEVRDAANTFLGALANHPVWAAPVPSWALENHTVGQPDQITFTATAISYSDDLPTMLVPNHAVCITYRAETECLG